MIFQISMIMYDSNIKFIIIFCVVIYLALSYFLFELILKSKSHFVKGMQLLVDFTTLKSLNSSICYIKLYNNIVNSTIIPKVLVLNGFLTPLFMFGFFYHSILNCKKTTKTIFYVTFFHITLNVYRCFIS